MSVVVAITGPSIKSLGAEAAYSLAQSPKAPSHIILLGRNLEKVQPVIDRISTLNASVKTTFVKVDLSSIASVRECASQIKAFTPKIDILINSAGIMAVENYTLSPDGFELQLAACHIGHFLLTVLLTSELLASSAPRVVTLTSTGYEGSAFRFDDYNFSEGKTYHQWLAYAQAKTANMLFTLELAKRVPQITALVVHPGVVLESGILQNTSMEELMKAFEITKAAAEAQGEVFVVEAPKTLQQGCSTTLTAALVPELSKQSGAFLRDCQVVPSEKVKEWARDEEAARKLWELSEGWVGEKLAL